MENDKVIDELNQKIVNFESQLFRQEETIKDQSIESQNLQNDL